MDRFFLSSCWIRPKLICGLSCLTRNSYHSIKLTHPSADRNSKPISEALLLELDLQTPDLQLLEISSGSGQHAAYLAPLCPNIMFQTSEFDTSMFTSIEAYAADCATKNIRDPIFVDISKPHEVWVKQYGFDSAQFDYIINFNMLHITPWACAIGLFRAAGYLLKPNGKLFTYGAYKVNGILAPESNVNFDKSLRNRNSMWGVRDIEDLNKLAQENQIDLNKVKEMPSNNKLLTWLKRSLN